MKIIKLAHAHFPDKLLDTRAWTTFSLNNTRGQVKWDQSSFYPVNVQTLLTDKGKFRYNLVGSFKDSITNKLMSYKMSIDMRTDDFLWNNVKNEIIDVELFEIVGGKSKTIAEWDFTNKTLPVSSNDFLRIYIPAFVRDGEEAKPQTPIEFVRSNFNDVLTGGHVVGKFVMFNFKRLTRRRKQQIKASIVEFWIEFDDTLYSEKFSNGLKTKTPTLSTLMFSIKVKYHDIENEDPTKTKIKSIGASGKGSGGMAGGITLFNATDAKQTWAAMQDDLLRNGYVDEDSHEYIPFIATKDNWDFVNNMKKSQEIETTTEENTEDGEEGTYTFKLSSFRDKIIKAANDMPANNYFNGEIPDSALSNIGTSNVDATQIKSYFSNVDDAIRLVNQFNPALLKSIASIFDFSQGGAYGVYMPAITEQINTKLLKGRLEREGYIVNNDNGMLTAESKDGSKSEEEINADIKKLYDEIKKTGGKVVGINMKKIMESAQADANDIKSPDPKYIYEKLAVLHLGETIVHECVHAQGNMSEGPSESAEMSFSNWALPSINEQYHSHLQSLGKESEFNPIIMGTQKRHASVKPINTWYKYAQYDNSPKGSDLQGRHGYSNQSARADYGLMYNPFANVPTEVLLSQQPIWSLSKDIDLVNDSMEARLRKSLSPHIDATKSLDQLLSKDHDDFGEEYKSMEEKLREKRPYPLMLPLKKASIMKEATLFGWFNNFDITDGANLEAMSDRVWTWDSNEEDVQAVEDQKRAQPRYNPYGFDDKGFWYQWSEPKGNPRKWDDGEEDTNIHPARRFAALEQNEDIDFIKSVLQKAKEKIINCECKAIRFVASDDITEFICNIVNQFKINVIKLEDIDQPINAIWISREDVKPEQIEKAETFFSKNNNEAKFIADELTGIICFRRTLISKILQELKVIGDKYELEDLFFIGENAREYTENKECLGPVMTLASPSKEDCLVYAQHLSEKFGKDYKYNNVSDIILWIGGLKVEFECGDKSSEIEKLKQLDAGINPTDNFFYSMMNRDFTINMAAYKIKTQELIHMHEDVGSKTLNMLYNPIECFKMNPFLIIKALKLIKSDGYIPSDSLTSAIEQCWSLVQDISEERKVVARAYFNNYGITPQEEDAPTQESQVFEDSTGDSDAGSD